MNPETVLNNILAAIGKTQSDFTPLELVEMWGVISSAMILAWAEDVDDSLAVGSGACFEIRAWDSVSGHTECCCITDEGLDTNEGWVEI